jgi:hypothetical protein
MQKLNWHTSTKHEAREKINFLSPIFLFHKLFIISHISLFNFHTIRTLDFESVYFPSMYIYVYLSCIVAFDTQFRVNMNMTHYHDDE